MDYPIIDNPLEWQAEMDHARESGQGPINTRGSARFWRTVQDALGVRFWRDGAPEFSRIVFELRPGVGLELSTDEGSPWIAWRFVPIEDEDAPM